MTSLMMKKYFLCLFFVVSVVNVCKAFAFPQEDCPGVLLTTLDKDHQRFRELSPEAQNMLQIASIIAQVTHSNDSIPVKVNIYHVLLATLTKIQSANEAIYRLNLVDIAGGDESKSALFVVLKNLGILRDFQKFLLEEIGLNSSNPEPFEFQLDRSLLLNLNEAVLTSTKINYDKEVDRLWNLAIREKEEEIRYINSKNKKSRYNKTFRIYTFPEHFFLASLSVDSSLSHFLLEYFNGKTPAQIKDTLYPLIDQARRFHWSFSKKKRRNSYSKEEKEVVIHLVIEREKEIEVTKAIAEVSEQTGIPVGNLTRWYYKYKREAIALVIKKKKEMGLLKAIAKVSKQTGISAGTLTRWFYYGNHEDAIALVIERAKEVEVIKAIAEVSEQIKIPASTLEFWYYKYKEEVIALVIKREKEIGIEKAILEISEQTGIPVDTLTYWFYYEYKAEVIDLVIEKAKEIEVTKAIAEVAEQTGIPVDTLTRWFYYKHHKEAIALVIKKKKEIGGSFNKVIIEVAKQIKIHYASLLIWFGEYKREAIALVIKKEKEMGLLKAIAEVSGQTGIPVDTLTYWFYYEYKAEVIDLFIERAKKIGVTKANAEVSWQTGIPVGTLKHWYYKYKREAIALVIEKEKEIGIEKAILEVSEQTGIPAGTLTRWFYYEHYGKAIALVIEREKEIGVTKAIAEVSKQTGIPVDTLSAWYYEYKAEAIALFH